MSEGPHWKMRCAVAPFYIHTYIEREQYHTYHDEYVPFPSFLQLRIYQKVFRCLTHLLSCFAKLLMMLLKYICKICVNYEVLHIKAQDYVDLLTHPSSNFNAQSVQICCQYDISTTATVTHGQATPSEQFFLELQKKLSDYYINFETNINFDKIIFFSSIS